ncbi:MAG TPA: NAD-dependent epimerase/dehydratase family protein [Nitriliruptorales bacterium]|nr:NAD-dependent epimerase/dehydratase family protein [Nitriliruptorales bacterium]
MLAGALEGRRVLITGGTGFIGHHVSRLLTRSGAAVTVLHSPGGELPDDADGRIIEARLGEDDVVYSACEGMHAVVHLAARSGGIQLQHTDHAELFAENLRITRQVLQATRRAAVPRVYLASSAVVYGTAAATPLREDAPKVDPGTAAATGYAWSKLTDEALGRWMSSNEHAVVIGRLANVYGPGAMFDPERSTVVHALVRKAVDQAPGGTLLVWGSGHAVRSFIFVEDAARAVVAILTRGEPGRVYNIDTSEAVSIRQLAETVREVVDPSLRLVFDADRPSGPPFRVLDVTALRGLGFEVRTSLREGLAHTVDAYRASIRPA